MNTPVARALSLALLASAAAHAQSPEHVKLLTPSEDGMVVAPKALAALRLADDGVEARLEGLRLATGERVDLDLRPFVVTSPAFEVRVGHARQLAHAAPVLLRGDLAGGGHAVVAVSERGTLGVLQRGNERFVISGTAPGRGLRGGPIVIRPMEAFAPPPMVEVCNMIDSGLAGGGVAGVAPGRTRQIELAVETDYEFFTLFGDLGAAADYVVALYGVIGDIYRRDVDVRIELTFVRLWDEEENLYNADNPLGPFVDHWNTTMQIVHRDVAQLLTGRRNLPYGGVAYLSALCLDNGYSVNGYMNGTFGDPEIPGSGNWDIVVVAHELGHNAGTPHTHSLGIDNCAGGDLQRGTIMSYCHTVTGGVSNIDLRFHTGIQEQIQAFTWFQPCIASDCNGNGIDDAEDIAGGASGDANENGIPDECEDCNDNGILDDQDIAAGTSDDVNANTIPDECEPDCNQNGVPDDVDIQTGFSDDAYGNGIPDECEADCNGTAGSDYNEIQADMALDIDRNAVLDACQDCDGDGMPDLDALQGGLNVWSTSAFEPRVREIFAGNGVPVKSSVDIAADLYDVVVLPSGMLGVTDGGGNRVVTIDPMTGALTGTLVTPGSGGLSAPSSMLVEDGVLYVSSRGNHRVLAYDAVTGDFSHVAAQGNGLLVPYGMAIDPDGALLVTSSDNRVLAFDPATGAFLDERIGNGPDEPVTPRGIVVTPDGRLLVTNYDTNSISAYANDGTALGQFDFGGLPAGFWGLQNPWDIELSRDGQMVFVSALSGNASIHMYSVATGQFQRSFYVLAPDLPAPRGFAVLPESPIDCNLNLRPDACDIAEGTSADVNENGIPDECEDLESCPADVTGDGTVDVQDLVQVILDWGPCAAICPSDANGDLVVDVQDLVLVVLAWGPCKG